MSSTEKNKLCYNKGCGELFDPDHNTEDNCVCHPGEPYFHDVYKEWTCCGKRCLDFSEFLAIKGCLVTKHNGEKPPDKPKKSSNPEESNVEEKLSEELCNSSINDLSTNNDVRMSYENVPMVKLRVQMSATLKDEFEKWKSSSKVHETISESKSVPIGTSCKNSGCNALYGEDEFSPECVHHPGQAIFHEGSKYWSCCMRKTADFTKFLNQVGCTTGKHTWFKKSATCRMDWHQTPSTVVVSIFAKKYHPEKSCINLSPIKLNIDLYFLDTEEMFVNVIDLYGVVKIESSSVSMFPTKIEVTMKKSNGLKWPSLTHSDAIHINR